MKTHSIRPKTEVYPSVCTVFVRSLSSYRLYGVDSLDEFILRFQEVAFWREYDLERRRKATREQRRRYYMCIVLNVYILM